MGKNSKTHSLFDDIFGEIGRRIGEELDKKLGTGGEKKN